jgi:hypothetical protein
MSPRTPAGTSFSTVSSAFKPPDNWVPGRVVERLLVSRDQHHAVIVDGFAVYPSGFSFSVTLVSRDAAPRQEMMPLHGTRGDGLTVRYADGAVSSEQGDHRVRLTPLGGSGSPTVWRRDWWCAPLPPPGPVEFEVTVPDEDDATGTIDGALLVEAAEQAVQLWPDRQVEPPAIDLRNAPALPPPGPRPADPDTARHEIRAAFSAALDSTDPSPDPLSAIQDGPALAGAREQARTNHPEPSATMRLALGDIVFIDEVRAAVHFQLSWTGAMTFGPQLGYAVLERGRWRVARDTYCRVLGWAGVSCPPPPPQPPTG